MKNIMDYWWYSNKRNRVSDSEQILSQTKTEDDYSYKYYSDANFLNITDSREINGKKYPVRLDKNHDYKYFSYVLGASPIFDAGIEFLTNSTSNDVRNYVKSTSKHYPENVARYYANDGTFQYILLDADDKGNAKFKIVPDKFIESSYTAFRPVFSREYVKRKSDAQEGYADEYKFVSEDGLYLIDQSKINSIEDVQKLIRINPLYIDQINPNFFRELTQEDLDNGEKDNLSIIKNEIEKFFKNKDNVERLEAFAKPVFEKNNNNSNFVEYLYNDIIKHVKTKNGAGNYKDKEDENIDIATQINKTLQKIIRDKQNTLEFLDEYRDYKINKYEHEFKELGLIPNMTELRKAFYPKKPNIHRHYNLKQTLPIVRRFMRLNWLKQQNELIEKYRDKVVSKYVKVPKENAYSNNGELRAQSIFQNELIKKYEDELLNSGFRYKNKNTGIMSAVNNEMNELDEKIHRYFTLNTNETISKLCNEINYNCDNALYVENKLYFPYENKTGGRYNAKPVVCIIDKAKLKDIEKYTTPYMIENGSEENKYLKNITKLIEDGTIIPICLPNSNFGNAPEKHNFRKSDVLFKKQVTVKGEIENLAINTYSVKANNPANKKFPYLKQIILDAVNENIKEVDKRPRQTRQK